MVFLWLNQNDEPLHTQEIAPPFEIAENLEIHEDKLQHIAQLNGLFYSNSRGGYLAIV